MTVMTTVFMIRKIIVFMMMTMMMMMVAITIARTIAMMIKNTVGPCCCCFQQTKNQTQTCSTSHKIFGYPGRTKNKSLAPRGLSEQNFNNIPTSEITRTTTLTGFATLPGTGTNNNEQTHEKDILQNIIRSASSMKTRGLQQIVKKERHSLRGGIGAVFLVILVPASHLFWF